jgi:EmrB/QacA subfamily drug resistance transporter
MARRGLDTTGAGAGPDIRLVLVIASLGAVLAPLNSTMIAVALPEIRRDYGLSHAAAGWLISAYLIAMAVTQPLGGRLGDQLGRVRVFRAGLLGFGALSLAAAFSPDFAVLVTLRIAQAVAGAVLIPNGMAMLRVMSPEDTLGRLNGITGAVLSAAAAAGPLLGAGALAVGSWRLVFPLSAPLVLAALVLLPRIEMTDERAAARSPVDWPGAALFVLVLTLVTVQLSTLREGGSAARDAALWVALALSAAAFAWRQGGTPAPVAQWRLFRRRSFSAATAWILLTNLTMYTTLLMIPFFVRDVQGRSAALAGLLLGAMSILVAVVSPLGGRLSDAHGRRALSSTGALIALAGALGLLALMRTDAPPVLLAAALAVLGVGLGLGTGPSVTAAIESAPRALAGTASGTSSMMRYIGSIIGAGLLSGVLTNSHSGPAEIGMFRVVAGVVVATAALALVASRWIHTMPAESRPSPVDAGAGRERAAAPQRGSTDVA